MAEIMKILEWLFMMNFDKLDLSVLASINNVQAMHKLVLGIY